MLEDLSKPVVFTGANVPLHERGTDGFTNMLSAIAVAGYEATGLPRLAEVVVCFGPKILRANRTIKTSTDGFDVFDSPGAPPLGAVGERIRIDARALRQSPDPTRPLIVHPSVSSGIAMVAVFPGINDDMLRRLSVFDGVEAVVLQTHGLGNVPSDPNFLGQLKAFTNSGKIVLALGSPYQDPENHRLYSNAAALFDLGVVPGFELTPEAATTKLAVLLASGVPRSEVIRQLQTDLRGEQSQSFEPATALVGPDGTALDEAALRRLLIDVRQVSEQLVSLVAQDPRRLWGLEARQFEELVAELLEDQGYEVTLTPPSSDGGRDIFAARKETLGSFLYLVECKTYAPERAVGVEVVRSLYGIVSAENATAGIVATTSRFTKGAKDFRDSVQRRMTLRDFLDLQQWLALYRSRR